MTESIINLGGQWLFAILLAGVGIVVFLAMLYIFGKTRNRQRCQALRKRLDRLEFPGAISGVDGRLIWANKAMRITYGDQPGEILQVLGNGIEVDAGLIYRLANNAREMGFALELVRKRSGDEMVILSAQLNMPHHFVWTVFPPDRLPEVAHIPGVNDGSREVFKFPPSDGASASDVTDTLESVPVALAQFDFEGHLLWGNSLAREMLDRCLIPGTALSDLVESLGRPLGSLIADAAADTRRRLEMVRLRGGGLEPSCKFR